MQAADVPFYNPPPVPEDSISYSSEIKVKMFSALTVIIIHYIIPK